MKHQQGIAYTDTGSGEITLLFLHYFGGSSNTWLPVIECLKDGFRCIAIDLPGFGESIFDGHALSIAYYQKTLLDFIQILELKNYVLVGHSMGGKIAMAMASAGAGRSLVLVAPSPPSPEPMKDSERNEMLQAYGNKALIEQHLKKITGFEIPPALFNQTVHDNLATLSVAWQWWLEQGSRQNITDLLKQVTIPVLVIAGSADKGLTVELFEETIVSKVNNGQIVEMQKTGHLVPLERPLTLALLIKEHCNHGNTPSGTK